VFFICGPSEASVRQVLFEPEGGGGDSQESGEAREGVAATLRGRSKSPGVNEPGRGGEDDVNLVLSNALAASDARHCDSPGGGGPTLIHALTSEGHDASEDGTGRGTPIVTVENSRMLTRMPTVTVCPDFPDRFHVDEGWDGCLTKDALVEVLAEARRMIAEESAFFATLNSGGNDGGFRTEPGEHLVAATLDQRGRGPTDGVMMNLQRMPVGVRRLTPLECERLQAFPDGWTCLCQPLEAYREDTDEAAMRCKCPDSPRYKALGNAVTVSVIQWIGSRL
jgi:Site-specific DNA methylase